MTAFDFKGEARDAWSADLKDGYQAHTESALRRAYAAGSFDAGEVIIRDRDLDRLVALAAGIEASENYAVNIHERTPTVAVAARAVKLLSALKAAQSQDGAK